MQTATNPKTGEVAVLVDNQWVKAESVASNDKGEKAYLVGGKWLTSSGAAPLPAPDVTGSRPATVSGVAGEIVKGLPRGAGNTASVISEGFSRLLPHPVGEAVRAGVDALARTSRGVVEASPQNEAERFAGTASEIVGGSVAGGGANTLRNAAITGISAITGATGEQLGGTVGKAGGAILPAIVDLALTFGRNIPKNIVARRVRANESTPYAARGKEISERTGINFSLGQETGDEATMLVEGMARKNPFSAKEFQQFGARQVGQSVQRLNKIMDDITPEKVGDIRLGTTVNNAFDAAVNGAIRVRRSQAAKDFGEVAAAAGDSKVVGTSKLVGKIDELINEFDVPGGGDATATLVNRLKSMKNGLEEGLTANQTNRLLQVYTNASAGKGQIFKDLDTAQQRLISGRLKDALLGDLDEAATAQYGGAPRLLAIARDNYRANSAAISKLEESVLGRYLGGDRSPERVADFITKAKPSELKQTLDIVNKADPATLPATRRYFIEKAIENAVLPPSQRNPSAPSFSAAKFIDAMPEGTKFEVVFGSSNARGELKMVGEALERIAYRGFTEGSPTAPLLMAWDAAKKVFTIQGLAGMPAAVIAPKTVAKASLTPEGRRALITLGRYDSANQSVVRSAAYLAGLASAEQRTEQQPTANTAGTAARQ
jgi:hypothetical protein